jgi:nucleoside phosphorylase
LKKVEIEDEQLPDNSATIDQSIKTESQHRRHLGRSQCDCETIQPEEKIRSAQGTIVSGENVETQDNYRKMEFELQIKED